MQTDIKNIGFFESNMNRYHKKKNRFIIVCIIILLNYRDYSKRPTPYCRLKIKDFNSYRSCVWRADGRFVEQVTEIKDPWIDIVRFGRVPSLKLC